MVYRTPFPTRPFKSAYGPNVHFQPNVAGVNSSGAFKLAVRAAGFGGAAGAILLLFGSSLPRVRLDILSGIPVVGPLFVKPEVHPADNPF